MRTSLLLLLALSACEPTAKDTGDTAEDTGSEDTGSGDTDTADTSDTDTADTGEPVDTDWTAVIGTVSTDYASGAVALATADGQLTEDVFASTPDTVVVVEGDTVFLLNRSAENTVQAFQGTDFSAPFLEFSTGDGSNPQDVATCGGHLFVTLMAEEHIGVYDPSTGLPVGTVDLSDFSDDDGSPEAGSVVVGSDGALYVALQQLDYLSTYASTDGSGTLVKVDCASMEVVESWDVGPNPRLTGHPSDADTLLVYGGDYYLPDWSGPKLDGGLWTFDVASGTLAGPHLTEEDLGGNLAGFAGAGDDLLVTLDDGYSWEVWCVSTTDWTPTLAAEPHVYVAAMAATPNGKVLAAQRQDFLGSADAVVGTAVYDLASCAAETTWTTTFPPYSVAILE